MRAGGVGWYLVAEVVAAVNWAFTHVYRGALQFECSYLYSLKNLWFFPV